MPPVVPPRLTPRPPPRSTADPPGPKSST
jgi:hypothetical protein